MLNALNVVVGAHLWRYVHSWIYGFGVEFGPMSCYCMSMCYQLSQTISIVSWIHNFYRIFVGQYQWGFSAPWHEKWKIANHSALAKICDKKFTDSVATVCMQSHHIVASTIHTLQYVHCTSAQCIRFKRLLMGGAMRGCCLRERRTRRGGDGIWCGFQRVGRGWRMGGVNVGGRWGVITGRKFWQQSAFPGL